MMDAENTEEVGDLFLDMCEALHENGNYKLARPLLEKLVSSQSYNLVHIRLHLLISPSSPSASSPHLYLSLQSLRLISIPSLLIPSSSSLLFIISTPLPLLPTLLLPLPLLLPPLPLLFRDA